CRQGAAACADAGEADPDRFLQAALPTCRASIAERSPCTQERTLRRDHPRLSAARYRAVSLLLRPWLLGRADRRALCVGAGRLCDPVSSGVALLPRPFGRLRLSRGLSADVRQ